MTPQPTPEQMEQARRIASGIAKGRGLPGARGAAYGKAYDAALTAILAADQQHAELVAHAEAMAGALERISNGSDKWVGGMKALAAETLTAFREYQKGRSDVLL